MTQVLSVPTHRFGEWRVVAPVCAAHFLSHFYMIMLAPLFAFIRADYGVSYTDLALVLTAFNLVSALLQTPVGFLVDRIGARSVLIAGVAIGALAFAVAGLVNSFTVFIAMFALAGLGNTVYHPADYSLLSQHGTPARMGQVFSFHTFSGILGGAVAPAALLTMQSRFGWRGAFVGAAFLGVAVLVLLIAQAPALGGRHTEKPRATSAPGDTHAVANKDVGWRVLLSAPILLNLGFFILISLTGGIATFLVVALGALYGTSDTLANGALTGLLFMNALGVLVGGVLASRTTRHAAVAALSLGGAPADDIAVRSVRRHVDPLARYAGARGDAARRLRARVRICLFRLQYRLDDRADDLRHADGPRRARAVFLFSAVTFGFSERRKR